MAAYKKVSEALRGLQDALAESPDKAIIALEEYERVYPGSMVTTCNLAQSMLVSLELNHLEWSCPASLKLDCIQQLVDPNNTGTITCRGVVQLLQDTGILSIIQVQKYLGRSKRRAQGRGNVLSPNRIEEYPSLSLGTNSAIQTAIAQRPNVIAQSAHHLSDNYLHHYRELRYQPPIEVARRLDSYGKKSGAPMFPTDFGSYTKDYESHSIRPRKEEAQSTSRIDSHESPTMPHKSSVNEKCPTANQNSCGIAEGVEPAFRNLRAELERRDWQLHQTKQQVEMLQERNRLLREKVYPSSSTAKVQRWHGNVESKVPRYPRRPPPLSPVAKQRQSKQQLVSSDETDTSTGAVPKSGEYRIGNSALKCHGNVSTSILHSSESLLSSQQSSPEAGEIQVAMGSKQTTKMHSNESPQAYSKPAVPNSSMFENEDSDSGFQKQLTIEARLTRKKRTTIIGAERSVSPYNVTGPNVTVNDVAMRKTSNEIRSRCASQDEKGDGCNPEQVSGSISGIIQTSLKGAYFDNMVSNTLKGAFFALNSDQERYESLRSIVWWLAECECTMVKWAFPSNSKIPIPKAAWEAFQMIPRAQRTMRLATTHARPHSASSNNSFTASMQSETLNETIAAFQNVLEIVANEKQRKEIVGRLVDASEWSAAEVLSRARSVGDPVLTAWTELGERARGASVAQVLYRLRNESSDETARAVAADFAAVVAEQISRHECQYEWLLQDETELASAKCMLQVIIPEMRMTSGKSWEGGNNSPRGEVFFERLEHEDVLDKLHNTQLSPREVMLRMSPRNTTRNLLLNHDDRQSTWKLSPTETMLRMSPQNTRSKDFDEEKLKALEERVARQVGEVNTLCKHIV